MSTYSKIMKKEKKFDFHFLKLQHSKHVNKKTLYFSP